MLRERMAILIVFSLAAARTVGSPISSPGISKQTGALGGNNWLHFHRDNRLTGWNPNETILTPQNVATPDFDVIWQSDPDDCGGVDSHMYASPLYAESVTMTTGDQYDGMQFSVALAATNKNYVCAIATFDPNGIVLPGTVLWQQVLGRPSTVELRDGIAKGIYGAPVIDLEATPPRLYVVGDTDICDSSTPCQAHRLFALDLGSGDVLNGYPLIFDNDTIGTNAPPGIQQNGPALFQGVSLMDARSALTLNPDKTIIYVSFGGQGPGFLVAVDTGTVSGTPAILRAFASAPAMNPDASGGIWAPGGPALDEHGNVYVVTGDHIPAQDPPLPNAWAESVLVFAPVGPPNFTFELIGTYTPWNHCQMDQYDADLAGSSTILFDVDPSATSTPQLLAIGGKQGNAYLLDRAHMPGRLDRQPDCHWDRSDPTHRGKLDPNIEPTETSLYGPETHSYYKSEDGTNQDRPGPLNLFGPYQEDCQSGPSARARTTPVYFQDSNGTAYVFFTGSTRPRLCTNQPTFPSIFRTRVQTPGPDQHAYLCFDAADDGIVLRNSGSGVISSNGGDFSSAVLWLVDPNVLRNEPLVGSQPILYAVDASSMSVLRLVFKSPDHQLEEGGKYNTPIVVNGTVLVGTNRITAYGLRR